VPPAAEVFYDAVCRIGGGFFGPKLRLDFAIRSLPPAASAVMRYNWARRYE